MVDQGYAECVPNPVFISAFSERPPLWEPLFWHSRCRYRRCRWFAGSTPHQSTALLKVIACLLSPQLFGRCRRNTQSSRVFLKDALMHPIGIRTRSIPPRSQAAASAERTGPFSRRYTHRANECPHVLMGLPMQLREGFEAAIWVGFSSLALVAMIIPLVVWYVQ